MVLKEHVPMKGSHYKKYSGRFLLVDASGQGRSMICKGQKAWNELTVFCRENNNWTILYFHFKVNGCNFKM